MKNLTRDIYVYNNGKLNDKGYFLLELQEKREAIDEVLREYLVKIIKMIKVVGHDLDELDVKGLIQYLKDALNPEDVDQVLSLHIIYYFCPQNTIKKEPLFGSLLGLEYYQNIKERDLAKKYWSGQLIKCD